MMENAPRRTWQHNWAPLLFLLDGIVEYSGSGLGVTLYDRVPVLGVAWGRFTISAIILFAYRAPHIVAMLREYSWKLLGLTAAFGLSLGAMNISFYEALARIPMGSAVALEYIGPVIMAVIAGKGWRVRAAILLALVGVFSISWGGVDIAKAGVPAGMGFAVLAGTWWIVYMVLGRKVAVTGHGIDHLTLGLMIAAVCYSPAGSTRDSPYGCRMGHYRKYRYRRTIEFRVPVCATAYYYAWAHGSAVCPICFTSSCNINDCRILCARTYSNNW